MIILLCHQIYHKSVQYAADFNVNASLYLNEMDNADDTPQLPPYTWFSYTERPITQKGMPWDLGVLFEIPHYSIADPNNPGNHLLAAEDLDYSRRQKLRMWSDWRADLNDHLLRNDRYRFHAIPNRAPRLPKATHPQDLMSYATADNSGTCMDEGHFLRIGIPRVQAMRSETIDEATRKMERDVRDLQFNKTPRLWMTKGFGKELAMGKPSRRKWRDYLRKL